MRLPTSYPRIASLLLVVFALVFAAPAMAHCDSMDGPVISDAQRALIEKDVTRVLKWVPADDEAEIRRAFDMTLAVRGESNTARAVADKYFFETLVRVHRASEGAPYTGLKPAGTMGPAIAASDQALATGDLDGLADELATAIRNQIKERFAHAYEKRQVAAQSVEQGREYVTAYVQFTHFVEAVANLNAEGISHGQGDSAHGH